MSESFLPVPERESVAETPAPCGQPHSPSWPAKTPVRTLWDGRPHCAVHLNARRGQHCAAVRTRARAARRVEVRAAATRAVDQLAGVGIAATADLDREGVTISLDQLDQLVMRLTPGWDHDPV